MRDAATALLLLTLGACDGKGDAGDTAGELPPLPDYAAFFEPPPTRWYYARLAVNWNGAGGGQGEGWEHTILGFGTQADGDPQWEMELLDDGEPIDDCDVYGPMSGDVLGERNVDGGRLTLDLGSRHYERVYEPEGGYDIGYGPQGGYNLLQFAEEASEPLEWGEDVSITLEGSADAPGFSFEPLTILPTGPVEITTPRDETFTPVPASAVVLRWKPLGGHPLTFGSRGEEILNVQCLVTDDGEFELPARVIRWMGSEPAWLDFTMHNWSGTRAEIEPGAWALFSISATSNTHLTVDPTR